MKMRKEEHIIVQSRVFGLICSYRGFELAGPVGPNIASN